MNCIGVADGYGGEAKNLTTINQGKDAEAMNQKLLDRIAELNRLQQAQAELNAVRTDYDKTLALLASLKAGEVSLDEVSLITGGWQLIDPPAEMIPTLSLENGSESELRQSD